MSYIALARKWRPKTFAQLVGQEHVNKALTNSLNQQRLHHAYLFTGTRGVGKTSVARLLAKALNCHEGISAAPCLQCDACLAIEQGHFFDLIEIDGASKTKVEDTREVLENVQYAPTSGRFKIYLIDEVHMLSQHSFNALLKTLEEPPAHVKFLLATTDPQKLPVTILSRCIQFHLKPIPPNIIITQLQYILEQESLLFEEPALEILAHAAKGSMRDALSLLDQAIACSDECLTASIARHMLGYTQIDYALNLLQALADEQPDSLITISRKIDEQGGHFNYVLEELLHHLHQITLFQCLSSNNIVVGQSDVYQHLSQVFSLEDIQLFYEICIKGIETLHLAPTDGIGFEMTLLRMCAFRPAPLTSLPTYKTPTEQISRQNVSIKPADATPPPTKFALNKPIKTTPHSADTDTISPPNIASHPIEPGIQEKDNNNNKNIANGISWATILPSLNLKGLALSAAEQAEFICREGKVITLRVDEKHQSVFTTSVKERITQALSSYFKENITISLKIEKKVHQTPAIQKQIEQKQQRNDATAALEKDPFFQTLQKTFSAEIVEQSVSLVEST